MTIAAMTEPATETKPDFAAAAALRRTMVERQLRPFDVHDVPVLTRFLDVPREIFLPAPLVPLAYSDLAMTVKGNEARWLAPPLVLARLLQEADIRPEHRVLDVAGGTGFPAALLFGLAAHVTALECDEELAAQTRANLAAVGADAVTVVTGPLEAGAPDDAPFDVILVHGAVEAGLDALFAQLAPNGRLLAYKRPEPAEGVKAVRFERCDGKAAGERILFDAAAPVLKAFAKAPAFVF